MINNPIQFYVGTHYTNCVDYGWCTTMPEVKDSFPNTKEVKQVNKDASGNVVSTNIDIVDENGNKISLKSYDKDGNLTCSQINVFNSDNTIRAQYCDGDGDSYVDYIAHYTYDNGVPRINHDYDVDGEIEESHFYSGDTTPYQDEAKAAEKPSLWQRFLNFLGIN